MPPVSDLDPIFVSITVEAPLAIVYQQWCQFDEFPHFMRGIDGRRGVESGRMVWRIHFDGGWVPWDAEVSHDDVDEGSLWNNSNGGRPCPNSGSVLFTSESAQTTRIAISCEFEPPPNSGVLEECLGELSSRLLRGLARFHESLVSAGGPWSPISERAPAPGLEHAPPERLASPALFNLRCPFSFCPQ